MKDMLLIAIAIPFGVGITGFLGFVLQPRDYPRRRSAKVDRGNSPFHGRNN